MIHRIIWLIFVVILITIGLGIYLQPDDLKNCSKAPGLNSYCRSADAIVAVSGGDTSARVNEAIALYKNGWANKLIFSGAAIDKTGPSNAAAMKALAITAGIPPLSIWLDEYSEDTKQNAQNSQTIFSKLNINSAILVTSGYHQRRAILEFNKRNKDVAIRSHPVSADADWSYWWWLTPNGWYLAVSEFAKIIYFYLSGIF